MVCALQMLVVGWDTATLPSEQNIQMQLVTTHLLRILTLSTGGNFHVLSVMDTITHALNLACQSQSQQDIRDWIHSRRMPELPGTPKLPSRARSRARNSGVTGRQRPLKRRPGQSATSVHHQSRSRGHPKHQWSRSKVERLWRHGSVMAL